MLSASRKSNDLMDFGSSKPVVAVIAAQYHTSISDRLVKGAHAVLDANVISYETFNVPGALDLPTALKLAVNSTRFDGYVVLGSFLDEADDAGAQTQFAQTLSGIGAIGGQGHPIGSAILFADSKKQLTKMASTRKDNTGGAAAQAALELVMMAQNLSGVTKNIGFKPASEFIQMAGEAPKTT